MAQGKTVLILGGGIGGVVATSKLRRALSREHRIVLVSKPPRIYFNLPCCG